LSGFRLRAADILGSDPLRQSFNLGQEGAATLRAHGIEHFRKWNATDAA